MQNEVRVHRVGSITVGMGLIAYGIMFILHNSFGIISYEMMFHLWPFLLIELGVEVLFSNVFAKAFVYDKAAVFLMMMIGGFAVGMACLDISLGWI